MATSSPNTVSFQSIAAPDLAAEQLQLQRQQQLADLLRQQAVTPLEQQTVSGAGPTRVVPISPVQGLAKMLTAYMANKSQENIDQKNLGLNQQLAQRYAQLLGGGTTPAGSGTGAGAPNGSPPMGMPAPQGAAPQGAPAGGSPSGFDLASLLRGGAIGQLGGDAAATAYWKGMEPTDATRMATQGGVDPMQANRDALAKANSDPEVLKLRQAGASPDVIYHAIMGAAAKNAEVERRGGNEFANFFTGQSGIVPKIPENANPVGPVAPNGALPGGVSQLPGALPIVGGSAQAGAAGTASGQFHDVTLPGGAKVPVRGAEIGPGGTLNMGPDDRPQIFQSEIDTANRVLADPQASPERKAAATQWIAAVRSEAKTRNVPLGQSTADATTQQANATMMQQLPGQITQSKQTVTGLENAYKTIDAIGKSGPGVPKTVNALAVLNNMGLPVAKGDTNGYQTLKKFLENSASTAAASNGFTGSDARFEQFKAGQPNAETMNPDALKGAIRYVLSQHDAAIARGSFLQQAAQSPDPNAVQKAQQQWSQVYNPRVFEFARLSPPEQAQFVKSMSPQQQQQFKQQLGTAVQQGWVP